jgi:hypothetical protein
MNLPDRRMLLGMSLGAICATALSAIGPGWVFDAFADEMPAGFDTGNLVKFDDRFFTVEYEDWVATEPLSVQTVKKIEAGAVSYVTITRTETGTYSTDGLTSRHVEYPGIEVNEVYPRPWLYWRGGKWLSFSSYNGNSFVYLRSGNVSVSTAGNGTRTCVSGPSYRVC